MTATSWDLGKLFLSIPVIVSIGISFLLALCICIDRLLELDGSVSEMAEVPTGNETPTLPASVEDEGKHPGALSEQMEPEEDSGKYPRASHEPERVTNGEEQLSMVALSPPLYSWLMAENLLFEICEKEERSTSESTTRCSPRTPGRDVSVNLPRNPDLSAEAATCCTTRGLPSPAVCPGKSGNEWQTSGIDSSSTDHRVLREAGGRSNGTEEHNEPNRGNLVMPTTEGNIRGHDVVGEIPVLRTKNGAFEYRGYDVKADEVSGCRQCDVGNHGCRQCRAWDADGSGCGYPGLQQQRAVCYEDHWMCEYFRLLNELTTERRMTESLTVQLDLQTMNFQKRICYLEDCLERLLTREAATPFSCETNPEGSHWTCSYWNCGQKDRRMGPCRYCCIALERAAEADTDARQVVQSCGTTDQGECHAARLGCRMEHGQCGKEHRRCQIRSGTYKVERCQTEPDSCQPKRRLCQTKTHLCDTEQGQCRTEQKRCQIEQRPCQVIGGQCRIEQERRHNEQRLCQMEQKQCQMEPKFLQSEHRSPEMEPSRRQEEQRHAKLEPRCEKEPWKFKVNPSIRRLEHQPSTDTVPDAATENGHDVISPEDQTNPTRNPLVKDTPGGLVLTSCDPSLSIDCPRTSGRVRNQTERGSSNPYDPHDGAGLRPSGERWLR